VPALGDTFTILTSSGGVTGTFNGLPEGGTVSSSNGTGFRVHYTANAVTLTVTHVSTANERFVAQLYTDLLQRPVDPSGLASWSAMLDHGASRAQVVLAIEGSQEYRTLLVQGLYQTFLHRAADPGGRDNFVAFLGSGGTVEQVQATIAGSPEYFQGRGGGTVDGFLSALYQDGLGRPIDASGRDAFTAALAQGASRGDVAAAIFSSTEYRQDLVRGYYERFLRREPDASGLDSFVAALRTGVPDQVVLAAILGSDEYFRRA
jgi:hypothetical protein